MHIERREFLTLALSTGAGSMLRADARLDDLTPATLVEASQSIRRKSVSPVELTRQCLNRIERLNPKINAYITVMGEQAIAQARELESEQQRGRFRGSLHGIPIALKDLIDTKGVRTTAASAVFADRIPGQDAEVVRRLKTAGAVIVGKLNMHEFAYGASSAMSHFGPVRNPWNLDRIAGGSSGGSAAAVAAGLCYGALGSDTGGSIRQPSAYCGLAGLKPTYGRVSVRGVIPLSTSLDHVGPMCRTVADAALVLSAIAGYDAADLSSVDAPVPDYSQALHSKVSSLRLGLPRKMFYENLAPEIETVVNQVIEVLRLMSGGIRDVQMPEVGSLPIVGAEAYQYHAAHFASMPEKYTRPTRERLGRGAKITAAEYIVARRELDRIRRSVRDVFAEVDLIITPTTPVMPDTVDEALREVGAVPGGTPSLRNTSPFNIFGLPAISIPCGFTADGLPVGIQISGRHFGEPQVLAMAHAYERATEWHTRRPKVGV
ncbi:MAG: amidase [Bryobacteraceae bacterium]